MIITFKVSLNLHLRICRSTHLCRIHIVSLVFYTVLKSIYTYMTAAASVMLGRKT